MDVALAEFNALRAEIVTRTSTQATLLGVGLTALGVLFALVAKEDADKSLLLAVPPLAAVVSLLHGGETYRIVWLGEYIRNNLWSYLRDQVGPLPSWEEHVATYRLSRTSFLVGGFFTFPATLPFVAASIVALVLADDEWGALWVLGLVSTVVAAAAPVILVLVLRAETKRGSARASRRS